MQLNRLRRLARRRARRPVVGPAVFLLAVAGLGGGTARATRSMMASLPSSTRFGCANCHSSPSPVAGDAQLNAFGSEFLTNGALWNALLAGRNADGDNCTNGFELADTDGDGRLDVGARQENSNPGDPNDCSIALTEQTWGKIKELFNSQYPRWMKGLALRETDCLEARPGL